MEKVSKKILEDAKKKSTEIIEQARNKEKEIKKKSDEEIKNSTVQIEKEVKEVKEKKISRLKGIAELEIRKDILATKRKINDSIFEKALDALVNREDYPGMIKWLLKEISESNEGEVIIGEKEARIDKGFINKFNTEFKTRFTLLEERRPIKGGFILRMGKVEIDDSFETLIEEQREKLEIELGKMLFA